jgi:hypothetical protein
LLGTTLCAGTALAANQPAPQAAETPAQRKADHDFGRISKDGHQAFEDIRAARLAIFDGDTNGAKTDINNAVTALDTAKSDDSIYMKAESDLKAPAGVTQNHAANNAAPDTSAVKWLPVDGAMALGEDYVATDAKAASVAKANGQLKQGEHDNAMQTLRLANVDVTFDLAVAPLDKTLAGVQQAQQLADAGHWFQANQALKGVEDNIRFDVEDFAGTPTGSGAHHNLAANASK